MNEPPPLFLNEISRRANEKGGAEEMKVTKKGILVFVVGIEESERESKKRLWKSLISSSRPRPPFFLALRRRESRV